MKLRALCSRMVWCLVFVVVASSITTYARAQSPPDFIAFETGPVRPIAISDDGLRLFVTNIPDNRLEIISVDETAGSEGLALLESVPVGMEPCAVAIEPNSADPGKYGRIWVVNHLSDSVSIVDTNLSPPRVVRTLLVGDEPRDIVFTENPLRAFITTAHRGQHRTHTSIAAVAGAGDPQLGSTAVDGIGRADVWVFDPAPLDQPTHADNSTIGGVPLRILTFLSDTPRALAVNNGSDGVYVGAMFSGNKTTAIPERIVCDGFKPNGIDSQNECTDLVVGGVKVPDRASGPSTAASAPAPEAGVIVQHVDGSWRDREYDPASPGSASDWSNTVKFDLPDNDVFEIDASSLVTAPLNTYSGVGTTLFNMVVHPSTGDIFVSNNHSLNHQLFSGDGDLTATTGSSMRGMAAQSRITRITPGATPVIASAHLNPHLVYGSADNDGRGAFSLTTPLEMAISEDEATLYVAAYGSAKVGVFAVSDIVNNTITVGNGTSGSGASEFYIPTGTGPAGLVLYESAATSKEWMFVLSRFDNLVSMFNVTTAATVPVTGPISAPLELYDSERDHIVKGRPLLYEAYLPSVTYFDAGAMPPQDVTVVGTVGNGEASCASCHIFGDTDHLSWNLGDPDATLTSANPQPPIPGIVVSPPVFDDPIHPLKGLTTTQTLRGLSTHGAMHWRGDRFFDKTTNLGDDPCTDSSGSACNEKINLDNFVLAPDSLLGRDLPTITTGSDDLELAGFLTNFLHDIFPPPNPVRELTNNLLPNQQLGRDHFDVSNPVTFDSKTCGDCHTIDPAQGFFGTSGLQAAVGKSQLFKVPQLRNLYTKVGMAGMLMTPGFAPGMNMGSQIRGFGFGHDGSVDTIESFLSGHRFGLKKSERGNIQDFIMAFPSDLAPMVGQQVTVTEQNKTDTGVTNRVSEMMTASGTPFASPMFGGSANECDLIVKGVISSGSEDARGWTYLGGGNFKDDEGQTIATSVLDGYVNSTHALTYTCVPPGSGDRMGIDRDNDGSLDDADGSLDEPPTDDPLP